MGNDVVLDSADIAAEQTDSAPTLHGSLEHWAATQPDAIAIKRGSECFSFAKLDGLANYVASELLDRSLGEGSLVGIWSADPAVQLIVSFGVWKAGMIALIVDTRDPAARQQLVLEHSQADAIVVCGEVPDRELRLPLLVELGLDKTAPRPPAVQYDHQAAAIVIYTSGSEGRPKGVVRSHGFVSADAIAYSELMSLAASDQVAHVLPLNYASGLKNAMGVLLSGSTLSFYDVQSLGLIPLADFLVDEPIKALQLPVSFFRRFVHHMARHSDTRLSCDRVAVGGERLYMRDVESFRKVFGREARLIHTYGATEAGSIANYVINGDVSVADPIPVGTPVDGKDILIVDDQNRELPPGSVGLVAVAARRLPGGYWRAPEATARKYVETPDRDGRLMCLTGDTGVVAEDGLLYLRSRHDTQLKIQGYRVDTSEIETVLNNLEHVVQGFVTASEDEKNEPRLTAYATVSGKDEARDALAKALRAEMAIRLPPYMLPHDVVILDVIPTTARGKVHPEALKTVETPDAIAPVTDTERVVIEIWEEMFDVQGVSVDDNILDLGVKSLTAMEMCVVLGRRVTAEVPYAQLALSPTVRELAEFIDAQIRES